MQRIVILTIISTFVSHVHGLDCYTCDSDASGQICIDNPAEVPHGFRPCPVEKKYCFSTRIEQRIESEIKVTVNRGCCQVKEGSSICPPGPAEQHIENDNPPFTIDYMRCEKNLCNSKQGDHSGGDGGGSIIVPGRSGATLNLPHLFFYLTTILPVLLYTADKM